MKKCIKCSAEINDGTVFCPSCGVKQEAAKKLSIGLLVFCIAGVVFASFLALACLGFIFSWIDGEIEMPIDLIYFISCLTGSVFCFIYGIKGIKENKKNLKKS